VYFDNVGGAVSDAVFLNLNFFARVSLCGSISQYNAAAPEMGPRLLGLFVGRRVNMRGFIVSDFAGKVAPAMRQHLSLLRHFQCVVDLDPEVTHSALKFGVPERELNSSEVLGPTIDQRRLGSTHRMRTVRRRVETNLLDPAVDDPRVLPRPGCGDSCTRLGNMLLSGFKLACLIHAVSTSRVDGVMSNCTGRCVLCCKTIARPATRSPWHTSPARDQVARPRHSKSGPRTDDDQRQGCSDDCQEDATTHTATPIRFT
jgi:hypothetical protein